MPDFSRADAILREEVETGFVPGISAIVFYKGEEVYYNNFGVCDLESGRKMSRDTIVRLFSMSKPVTAVAAMILVERGLMSMEDPLEKYLPEFAQPNVWLPSGEIVRSRRSITIWDLFHMTSGVPYPTFEHLPGQKITAIFHDNIRARRKGKTVTTRDYMKQIAQVPLCFEPGSKWYYGLSADILGAVVEVVSGKRFDEFLREEIFEPLQMTDTGFYVPADKRDRFAAAYEPNRNGLRPYRQSHLGEYYGEDVVFLSGGAGMVSTIDDYLRFTRMLSGMGSLGDVAILRPETVRYMATDGIADVDRSLFTTWESLKGYGYGCLMRTLICPQEAASRAPVGEFGWDGWMGTYMQADPVNDLSIVYLIQRCGTGTAPETLRFRNEVYRTLGL